MKRPGKTDTLFQYVCDQSAKPKTGECRVEKLIQDGPEPRACRINALAFAGKHQLDEEDVIAAFSARARDSAFSICPGTSSVPVAVASSIRAQLLKP